MAKKPTKTELTQRMRNCMGRMSAMPVDLGHAYYLTGFTEPMAEVIRDESKRAVLFTMHALLCTELAETHAVQARDHILEKVRAASDGNGD